MNNSKMWLVVSPSVGVPIFLGAVAVGSFAVHVAVVTNTSWVADFLSGEEMGSTQTASIEAPIQPASMAAMGTAKVYSATADQATGDQAMVVVLPDGRMAKAVFEKPLASASLTD